MGEVREERRLEMGNVSDAVTSSILFLTTPWAAILRGIYMTFIWYLDFGVSVSLTFQSWDFLPAVEEQW